MFFKNFRLILSDSSELAAGDVLLFIREAIQRMPHLRTVILSQLLEVFPQIKNLKIFRAGLWILGEYCSTLENMQSAMTLVRVFLFILHTFLYKSFNN